MNEIQVIQPIMKVEFCETKWQPINFHDPKSSNYQAPARRLLLSLVFQPKNAVQK
jgi:hypothetical protein